MASVVFFGANPAAVAAELAKPLMPEDLARGPGAIVAANPQGDVNVIEFFDYQCPICRRTHPEVMVLENSDRGARIIHKHWPVFGAPSVYAARLALASRWQNKYEQAHDALMGIQGKLDEAKIRAALSDAGVDLERLDRDVQANAKEIDAAIEETSRQAQALRLRGTPTFVIGNKLVAGGLDVERMKELVREQRALKP